jgi:hypothetical protein
LTVKGEFTRSVYADPEELTFGQMAGNEPIVREARILCTLPNQKIAIQGHTLSDPSQETFFQVDCLPLSADELRKYQGAMSGVLIRVTVKPGLPLGRFQQRITLKTDVETAAEVDLPVFGSVGDITLVGPGWSSETGVLDLGMVDGHSATQRQLIVLARGVNAKEMQFKIASVEPDFLKARLGKTTAADTGDLSKTELLIEIPERKILEKKSDLNGLGANKRNFGEIVLETTGSQVRSLRIRVRFAVVGGTEKEKK